MRSRSLNSTRSPRPPHFAPAAVLLVLLAVPVLRPSAGIAAGASALRSAFERFRPFSGTWEGRSTRGWTERLFCPSQACAR